MTTKHLISPRRILSIILIFFLVVIAYIIYFIDSGKLPQTTVDLLPMLTQPNAHDRIVVFAPHQDDEVLGAGGFIAAAAQKGAQVSVVFASDGNKHGQKTRRRQEAKNADAVIGVPDDKLTFYDLPDGHLSSHQDQLGLLVTKMIADINPTIILVTDPRDIHSDHAILGQTVRDVINNMQSKPILYTYLIHFPMYPRPQMLDQTKSLLPPKNAGQFAGVWLRFNLGDSAIGQKRRAILQYHSQLHTPFLRSLMLSFIRQNELFLQVTL